jgi:hypothetical protein
MYFLLDEDFYYGVSDTVTFKVTYLDKDPGSEWSFLYDAGGGDLKEAFSITCDGSGTWKTHTVTVHDAVLDRNGPLGSDFALLNTDSIDDIFHMIEVEKKNLTPTTTKAGNSFPEPSSVSVYPNPALHHITIDGLAPHSLITIMNIHGSIMQLTMNDISQTIDVSLADLAEGIYLIQVSHKNTITDTLKLCKN